MKLPDKFIARLTWLSLTSCLLILILSVFKVPTGAPSDQELSYTLRLSRSDNPRSALELKTPDATFHLLGEGKTTVKERFAYLWITVHNKSDKDKEIMVGNMTRNYFTELLQSDDRGVITLFQHGDTVSPALWPVKHNKPLFPVLVPQKTKLNLIMEAHGPRGIVIDPALLSVGEALAVTTFYRSLEGSLYGAGMILILLLAAAGILRKQRLCGSAALFGAALLFFSLRQSRVLLLLISPFSYPEWLFPLSIYANSAASVFFGFTLFEGKMKPLQKNILLGLLALGGILAGLSTAFYPYLMADLLNLNGLVILAFLLYTGGDLVHRGHEQIKAVLIAFIPWIIMMVWDILVGYLGLRDIMLLEYRTACWPPCSCFPWWFSTPGNKWFPLCRNKKKKRHHSGLFPRKFYSPWKRRSFKRRGSAF